MSLDGRNSHSSSPIYMLVGSLELKVDLLKSRRCLSVNDIVVESDRLVLIDSTNVPLIRSAQTDLGI